MKHTLKYTLIVLFYGVMQGQAQEVAHGTLSMAALELTNREVAYDGSYFSIAYPNGDVPEGKGVCTDVIIRAYRKLDVDL